MRLFILDDDELRHAAFAKRFSDFDRVHVRTVDEALSALRENKFDIAFLDHDLNMYEHKSVGMSQHGPIELTGAHVAAFITAMDPDKRPSFAVVHSWNPAGARNIIEILREAGVETHQWEFRPNFDGLFIHVG